MPPTKKGDVAPDDISKCPFFNKISKSKLFNQADIRAESSVVQELDNGGNKRIMTD